MRPFAMQKAAYCNVKGGQSHAVLPSIVMPILSFRILLSSVAFFSRQLVMQPLISKVPIVLPDRPIRLAL